VSIEETFDALDGKEYSGQVAAPAPKDTEDVSQKLTSEYREKYELYAEFAAKTASILEQVLKDEEYRYQVVTHRAKKPNSASARFAEKKCQKLDDLKDLAGSRVIFYLESDVKKFVGKLYEIFGEANIVDHEDKISTDGYNAVHIVIRLGDDRLVHPEYKRYQGLQCEVQLTTVLHHAWSEMEHDIVYKPQKELSAFDARAFEAIQEMFKKTMKEHIQPAVRDLEHIVREHEKLKQGRGVFDAGFLKQIEDAATLNDMHQYLKVLLEYAREFGNKAPKELPLTDLLRNVLTKAKQMKVTPVKTVFGHLRGTSYRDIALIVLEILDVLRYWGIDKVCAISFELLKEAKDASITKKASEVLTNISKFNLQILRVGRYHPQTEVMKFLKSSGALGEAKTVGAVANMLKEVLTLSFHATEWGYNETKKAQEMTMTPTSLNPTPTLRKLRKDAIAMLKTLFVASKKLDDKRAVIHALQEGTQWPEHGVTEKVEDMEKMLRRDIDDVVSFYASVIEKEENETVQEIEEHLVYIERGANRKSAKSAKVLKSIFEMPDYHIFKVFVGHDVRFFPDFDFDKAATYRNEKIKEYIADITETTLPRWKKTLRMVTKNHHQSQGDNYTYFHSFLLQLAQQKPKLAKSLLNEPYLKAFILNLVAGIWKADKAQAKRLLRQWIHRGENLSVCAAVFDYVEEIDNALLLEIAHKAKSKKDENALTSLTSSIARNYTGQPLLKKTFLDVVSSLTKIGSTFWVRRVWFRKDMVTKDLSEKEVRIIFENLLPAEHFGYELETLFEPIVEKHPEAFIDFLLKRVQFQMKLKSKNRLSRYDAIPHDFDKLGNTMRDKAAIIIPLILRWYSLGTPKKDQWLYRWEASHLLKEVFPGNPLLEEELLKMLKRGGKDGRAIIDEFISRFEGEEFLWRLVEEAVNTYKEASDYKQIKGHLFGYLSQTGVVSGEYGFAEAHTNKKNALAALKNTQNAHFLAFLNEYEDYLEKRIVAETKSADDEIDRRRKEFGK